jgi:hypothetical protein
LTHDIPAPAEPAAAPAATEPEPVPAGAAGPAAVTIVGKTSGGLPKRRRAVAVVPGPDAPGPEHPEPDRYDGRVTESRLGAYARGTFLGRDASLTEGSQDQ